MNPILESIVNSYEFRELIHLIESRQAISPLDLPRSARLPILACIYHQLTKPLVLITDKSEHASMIQDELQFWLPQTHTLLFSEPNSLFYENAPWGENTRINRLKILSYFAYQHRPGYSSNDRPPIIIAPIRGVMTRTIPRRDFLKACHSIQPGDRFDISKLVKKWVSIGYQPTSTVIAPGEFARRGGIVDIWPIAEAHPSRIDFFGDEIDEIKPFEPANQRTLPIQPGQGPSKLLISPAREFILEMDNSTFAANLNIPDDPSSISEFHIPLIHKSAACISDYFLPDGLVLLDNLEIIQNTTVQIEEQSIEIRQTSIAEEKISNGFPVPYLSLSEIIDTLHHCHVLNLGPPVGFSELPPGELSSIQLGARFSPGPRFAGQLKPFLDNVHKLVQNNETVHIISRQASRIQQLLMRDADLYPEQTCPTLQKGNISDGWIFSPQEGTQVHVYTDGEIFGWHRARPRRHIQPQVSAPEANFDDLAPGDWVVHIDHGIGQFRELVTRSIDKVEREYLCIEYANQDMLFVPVYQADRLGKYIGSSSSHPSATRLGGTEWHGIKSRVKQAVHELAFDLLSLYAKRKVTEGIRFDVDTNWQHELEASFPYVETDDQIKVLREVKVDMEAPKPMDRLICGDVGYGKTEVALRAAFKAVMSGKQVAMLVPTTILAQQHFDTFRQRLAGFPVEIEMLSRFRTQVQQDVILKRLMDGSLDIVVGTHRLIQNDVKLNNLGLLIIDEEQRFGVTHKEFFKNMRTEVDVLTMTATPIPRTLYLALTGIRDISTINTPPDERLPVITQVGPFSKPLLRKAILRELERGGQVFFVHNRVKTIRSVKNMLVQLVPEARIEIAHGQMKENELAQRMVDFNSREVDVLLCTTIIESGLDIPNANTIIVDRADTFGMAQLYQLRGRVGRGATRAYAYFFRHKQQPASDEGEQRLETLREHQQLGAGFSISMRDLEMRGAGDIIGPRQHGLIAAVGFHLYTRLLAQEVKIIQKGEQKTGDLSVEGIPELKPIVTVELPIAASIPKEYIPDRVNRLGLYRRMANLESLNEIDDLQAEFNDRFGPPPDQVLNLLYQLKLKHLAEKSGFVSVTSENDQIVLRFITEDDVDRTSSHPDARPNFRRGKHAYWFRYIDHQDWQEQLLDFLKSSLLDSSKTI